MSFLTHSYSNLYVRLWFCVSRLIWSLYCICNMLLLTWFFRWMLWCKLMYWFEFSFCSTFFLHACLIITESSLIYLAFELMLRVSWLSFLFEMLSACWICITCKINEWVHISLNWKKSHIIWLNSDIFCEFSSACSSFISWMSHIWVDWCCQ